MVLKVNGSRSCFALSVAVIRPGFPGHPLLLNECSKFPANGSRGIPLKSAIDWMLISSARTSVVLVAFHVSKSMPFGTCRSANVRSPMMQSTKKRSISPSNFLLPFYKELRKACDMPRPNAAKIPENFIIYH